MSVTELRPRTPAETRLLQLAEARGENENARRPAIEALRRDGLPTRRVEAWHYTDLRQLLGKRLGTDDAVAALRGTGESMLEPFVHGSAVIDLDAPQDAHLPAGLTIEKSDEQSDWQATPNHLDRSIDTVRALNVAFGAVSNTMTVAAGTTLDQPVEMRAAAGAQSHAFTRVVLGEGSKSIFVERLEGGPSGVPSTGVNTLDVGAGAEVLWIVAQEKAFDATHLGQLSVRLEADSVFKLFVLNAGGGLVRYEVHTEVAGEGADVQIRGVNLLQDGQHIDVTTTLNHTVENTTATETFRNVVLGGHGVFQGMIKVARGAQKTDAKMACNSLLLSDEGDFSAKPELEIFADDVQCGHGATAGEIDANHLFYLMSRGIPLDQARALLIKAFVTEVVEQLEEEAVENALNARIDAWLSGHDAR
ncbi:Fe-S cluster assembly protein SufD [Fulvimarina sp. 2208YS6-2-32]|uniref:Fe-S cluster assembly protein SufD n=1 Tax=Fulvimarina uroteuthidis TaxID=3098149 RepID=A0ABU5I5H1_9HYPH|nr:Fe-S cluster assembly protein SufD [Fulvimarina sp. 2208YS6-2-32]MDY8110624.1 Fe-S cluster assembly protein SufD [Fulvimarina sp. 2208YS6-2-32]